MLGCLYLCACPGAFVQSCSDPVVYREAHCREYILAYCSSEEGGHVRALILLRKPLGHLDRLLLLHIVLIVQSHSLVELDFDFSKLLPISRHVSWCWGCN